VAKGIEPDEAIARMGFETEPHHYRLVDVVVASIVLENVEKRLPAWSALRADGSFVCARKYRDDEKVPNRKVLLQTRRSFVINWADSGLASVGLWRITSRGSPTMIGSWSPHQQIAPMALATANSPLVPSAAIHRSRRVRGGSSAATGKINGAAGSSSAGLICSTPG
jgi:hypothetical protein